MKGFRVYDEYVEKYVTNEFCWLVDSDGEIKSLENGNLISYPHCIKEDETGLTDKNGKKIFEGDIVKEPRFVNINNKTEDRSFYFQVKWIDCMLCLSTLQKYADKPCRSILMVDEMELIGNIHDNPELLEV